MATGPSTRTSFPAVFARSSTGSTASAWASASGSSRRWSILTATSIAAHLTRVYHSRKRSRSEARNQLVLNLARADVSEWLYKTLDRLLSDHEIEFVKWDMNRHFSEPGWPAMSGNNPERIWIDHVRNLYGLLEQLRTAHPKVTFESCSGGGGRVDIGILSRVEQAWTSDNTDAWDRIAIQEGYSQIYAPMSMMAWVTDSPNPLTARVLPLSYRFHVAMTGSLGIGGDLTRWSTDELGEARELVDAYKSIRHLVQHGRLYRLASVRKGTLGAVEYLDATGNEAVVLAFWGVKELCAPPDTASSRFPRSKGALSECRDGRQALRGRAHALRHRAFWTA